MTLLEAVSADFEYEKNSPVFSDLSLKVNKGDFLCILGKNGCGKTTLLSCFNKTLRLNSGSIRLKGKDLSFLSQKEIAKQIGYVYQEQTAAFPFKVLDIVGMGRAPYLKLFSSPSAGDMFLAENALKKVGIYGLKDKYYSQLSGGERQMVLIAMTICQNPEVIILDEPTNHLDFRNQAIVLEIIKNLSMDRIGIIMTSHQPNHAFHYANKVALMNDGGIVAYGKPDEVLTEDSLKKTYDIDVNIFTRQNKSANRPIHFCFAKITE